MILAESLPQLDVSRETYERLRTLEALTAKWTERINLISRTTRTQIWTRHIVDSAQLLPLAPRDATFWTDLGSGGGFPGLVLGCLLADRPEGRIVLIESDQRKCAFLRTAKRELGIPAQVLAQRIEQAPPARAQVLTARALAPLSDLLSHAERHLAPGGCALFPKGRTASAEIADARRSWVFDCDETPSITDPDATLLRIERIARA